MLRLFVRVARSGRGAVPAPAGKVCCGVARWLPGSGRRLAVAAAVAVVAAVAAAPSALAGVPGWVIQASANPPGTSAGELLSVSCPSAVGCLAVGFNMTPDYAYSAFAESWDGATSTWTIVSPVLPPAAALSMLTGVSCTSAAACTAVGSYETSGGVIYPLAERWNGTSWRLQNALAPAGSTYTALKGVSCTSALACVAVGASKNPATGTLQDLAPAYPARTLAESWDGSSWTAASTRDPATATQSSLGGVSCPYAAVCTAVGTWDAWTPSTSGFFSIDTLAERYS